MARKYSDLVHGRMQGKPVPIAARWPVSAYLALGALMTRSVPPWEAHPVAAVTQAPSLQ
jgi:hypothetical protein